MEKYLLFFLLLLVSACRSAGRDYSCSNRKIISGTITFDLPYLTYATWDSTVVVENVKTKKKLRFKTLDLCYAKPFLVKNRLYFPASNSSFWCINITSGKLVWKAKLGGKCSDFQVSGNNIIANSKNYGILGIDGVSGLQRFRLSYKYNKACLLPDLSPYRIKVGKSVFYICDWQCKSLSAYECTSGELMWDKSFNEGTGNIELVRDNIFYGRNQAYEDGEVMILDLHGTIISKQAEAFEEKFLPIVKGDKVYYYSHDSKLHEMDVLTKKSKVIFVFDEINDVSGNQMFLMQNKLYYSAKNSVFCIDLSDFSLTKVSENLQCDVLSFYEMNDKVEFVH